MFPHRSRLSRTCFRSAGTGGARPGDQGDVYPFTRYRPRSREHRTRSRFAFVFHVVQVAVRGIVRGPGAPDPAKVKRGLLLDSIASTA